MDRPLRRTSTSISTAPWETGATKVVCRDLRRWPSSLNSDEDEGYVMAFAHDLGGGNTELVILAARDFAGEPVARIHLAVRVPLGIHGSWIGDS